MISVPLAIDWKGAVHCKKCGVYSTPKCLHTYGVSAHSTVVGVHCTPIRWCASLQVCSTHHTPSEVIRTKYVIHVLIHGCMYMQSILILIIIVDIVYMDVQMT